MAKKPKKEKTERMRKLDELRDNTNLSAIKKELIEAVNSSEERLVRNLFYTYKMWTLNADPNKEMKKNLEVAIRSAEKAIIRDKKLGLPIDAHEEMIVTYKKKLKALS